MESTDLAEQLTAEQETNLVLRESLAAAQLALDDIGWQRFTTQAAEQFTRDGLTRAAEVGRVMAVTNALIKRAIALRVAYIWGEGVEVAVRAGDEGQDVNQVVQAFLDDAGNKAAFTGEQAHEENERALGTDGNVFLALFTLPASGVVQVRTFGFPEIVDVICNPDDKDDPWYYQRRWTTVEVDVQAAAGPSSRTVNREEFYPALGYRPLTRPRFIDGKPVNWDTPVLHECVNRLDGWKFGVGDVYTAIPWARAYREFLQDWAQLVKSLSQFAFQLSSKGSKAARAAQLMRERLSTVAAAAEAGASTAGATYTGTDGNVLEAIPKSGATIDSESGRPLAAMVAAGLDLPVTMLLGDPGVTGARATAETLDQPMALSMKARRTRHTETYRRVLEHVIRESVRAPRGVLKGTITRNEIGREVVTLTGGDPVVEVTWPSLDDVDVSQVVSAIATADATGKMPPLTTVRLLLQALGVDDVDDLLDDMTDADGNWVDPNADAQAAADRDAAARALAAVQSGDQPRDDPQE